MKSKKNLNLKKKIYYLYRANRLFFHVLKYTNKSQVGDWYGAYCMLKSCKYCLKIHDSKLDCDKKPVRKKYGNNKDKFRWTHAWQKK